MGNCVSVDIIAATDNPTLQELPGLCDAEPSLPPAALMLVFADLEHECVPLKDVGHVYLPLLRVTNWGRGTLDTWQPTLIHLTLCQAAGNAGAGHACVGTAGLSRSHHICVPILLALPPRRRVMARRGMHTRA